jgi:hypothetical protein
MPPRPKDDYAAPGKRLQRNNTYTYYLAARFKFNSKLLMSALPIAASLPPGSDRTAPSPRDGGAGKGPGRGEILK